MELERNCVFDVDSGDRCYTGSFSRYDCINENTSCKHYFFGNLPNHIGYFVHPSKHSAVAGKKIKAGKIESIIEKIIIGKMLIRPMTLCYWPLFFCAIFEIRIIPNVIMKLLSFNYIMYN